ncbi:MAG: hypothetical protein R3F43_02635 [bacterium]
MEHWVLHAGYQSPTATLNMEVFKVASGVHQPHGLPHRHAGPGQQRERLGHLH